MSDHHASKKSSAQYRFHPFEIAFCGYSNSGKTTLISKLIQALQKSYDIAYVKHDAHSFDMDREGKDTYQMMQSGAKSVLISDQSRFAQISLGSLDKVTQKSAVLDYDFLFIEGYKQTDIPKIIVLDEEASILTDEKKDGLENVLAFVGSTEAQKELAGGQPFYHRDDVEGLRAFILNYFDVQTKKSRINGLVLAGGKSKRMGKDKSQLQYHGKIQLQHCCELLDSFCENVFVSNREGQHAVEAHKGYPSIHDSFLDLGPMGGILSAMKVDSTSAWLVIACDLPFITGEVLRYLLEQRNPFKYATAYQSAYNDFPEPLCTIYEPKAYVRLLQFLSQGYSCPRKVLINSSIELIQQQDKQSLDNVNYPEEFDQVMKNI